MKLIYTINLSFNLSLFVVKNTKKPIHVSFLYFNWSSVEPYLLKHFKPPLPLSQDPVCAPDGPFPDVPANPGAEPGVHQGLQVRRERRLAQHVLEPRAAETHLW